MIPAPSAVPRKILPPVSRFVGGPALGRAQSERKAAAKDTGAHAPPPDAATATDIGIETLSERISREVISSNSVLVHRSEIGAWTRV
jgi:hypothetical protein